MALSILAPDLMATLEDYAATFDVEIYGSCIRIISNREVLHDDLLLSQLQVVAQKVMIEVDHRLQSWGPEDSRAALKEDLRIYQSRGRRMRGRLLIYPWRPNSRGNYAYCIRINGYRFTCYCEKDAGWSQFSSPPGVARY